MSAIIEPRNRVYPATEDAILAHRSDAERMGYAQTRDALPRYCDRYVWDDEGEPASGRQTAAVVGVIVCGVLLLAGLAYLVWAGANGGFPWQR